MLRGTTGVELARQMKKIRPDVPVVLFSGSAPDHMNGADVYINKGEPTSKVLSLISDVIRRYAK